MVTFLCSLQQVRTRIATACDAAGRDVQHVVLVAVSKTFGAGAVRAAFDCGQRDFGENYIQEAVDKIKALAALRDQLQWHCIGPIQSNKTRWVAQYFDWAHTIDRLKIAQRLSEQRPSELAPLQVCIQVNIDASLSKSGVAPDQVVDLAEQMQELPRLRLRGLMTIPQPADSYEATLAVHRKARSLFNQLNRQGFELDTLSMGMSADLEAAISAGSTMVRVGSAIFGARHYP